MGKGGASQSNKNKISQRRAARSSKSKQPHDSRACQADLGGACLPKALSKELGKGFGFAAFSLLH